MKFGNARFSAAQRIQVHIAVGIVANHSAILADAQSTRKPLNVEFVQLPVLIIFRYLSALVAEGDLCGDDAAIGAQRKFESLRKNECFIGNLLRKG